MPPKETCPPPERPSPAVTVTELFDNLALAIEPASIVLLTTPAWIVALIVIPAVPSKSAEPPKLPPKLIDLSVAKAVAVSALPSKSATNVAFAYPAAATFTVASGSASKSLNNLNLPLSFASLNKPAYLSVPDVS